MEQNKDKPVSVANLIQKKRFNNEKKLLENAPLGYITAYPKEDNPLIWYILVVGQKGSHYEGGHFIGEIHHSPKYPAEPPDYIMRTPNGRYEIDKKICLSNSGYHKGEWSSTWNIHTILIAFYSIWLDDKEHGISHITRSKEERLKYARESIDFNMKKYGGIYTKFNFDSLSFDVDHDPKYCKKQETVLKNESTQQVKIEENVQAKSVETKTVETKTVDESKLLEQIKPAEPNIIAEQTNLQKTEEKIIEKQIIEEQIKELANSILPVNGKDNSKTVTEVNQEKIGNIIFEDDIIHSNNKIKHKKKIIVEDDTNNLDETIIEDSRNVKQKLNFKDIFNKINSINKTIDEQQKSINNLTNKLSNSFK